MEKDEYMYMEMLKLIVGDSRMPAEAQMRTAAQLTRDYRRIIAETNRSAGTVRPMDIIKGNQ